MLKKLSLLLAGALSLGSTVNAETITIATVNNGDMITMKELSSDFEKQNPSTFRGMYQFWAYKPS